MKKGKLCSVLLISVCCVVLVRGQHVGPIVSSQIGNPSNQNRDIQSGISVISLDKPTYGSKGRLPPTWIDPFSSGTYSKSITPHLNWNSLMWSNSLTNMAHNTGLIPTVQLGEGIPVDSVKVVDDRRNDGISINNKVAKEAHKKVVKMHDLADLKDLPSSFQSSSSGNQNLPNIERMGLPLGSSTNENEFPNQNVGTSAIGLNPSVLSSINQGTLDLSGLSPDNPAHADIIDFMITKDMANGMPEVLASSQGQTLFDPDQSSSNIFPQVPPNDIIPKDDTVRTTSSNIDSTQDLIVDNTNIKTTKPKKVLQKKRKQNRLDRQHKRQNRKNQRIQRQKQNKRQGKKGPRKQKFFSEKLAARKRKLREQRLQRKLEKHLKKIDNISQKLDQNAQTGTNMTPANPSKALSVVTNEKEQTNVHDVNPKNEKKGQNKNKERKNQQKRKRVTIRQRKPANKNNQEVNNKNQGRNKNKQGRNNKNQGRNNKNQERNNKNQRRNNKNQGRNNKNQGKNNKKQRGRTA